MAALIHAWFATAVGSCILIFLAIQLWRLVGELLRLSKANEVPEFESNWGGLGRGLGGWSVNSMMVIAALTFAVLLLLGSITIALMETSVNTAVTGAPAEKLKAGAPPASDAKTPEPAAADSKNSLKPVVKE